MGKINSKYRSRFSTTSHFQPLLSSSDSKRFPTLHSKRRLSTKKKVLLLGLDGVGKTHLFTRLISDEKQPITLQSLPQPTIGSLSNILLNQFLFLSSRIQCRNNQMPFSSNNPLGLWWSIFPSTSLVVSFRQYFSSPMVNQYPRSFTIGSQSSSTFPIAE